MDRETEPFRDVRFLIALEGTPSSSDRILMVWSELQPVADGFLTNLIRVYQPGNLMIEAMFGASVLREARSAAELHLGLRQVDFQRQGYSIINRAELGADEATRLDAEATEFRHMILNKMLGDFGEKTKAVSKQLFEDYVRGDSSLNQGLEVMLESMVINAWTSFETAATDLWVAALNDRADPLALRALMSNKGEGKKSDEPQGEHSNLGVDETSTAVRNWLIKLIKDGEPIRAGVLVRRTSKTSFDRYPGIQLAYMNAFGMEEAFFKSRPFEVLHALDAVRNVLVHRAGHIDRMFLKRVSWRREVFNSLSLANYGDGDRISLDGVTVNAMLAAVKDATELLFGYADDWFKSSSTH